MKRASIPQPIGWASIFAASVIALGLTLLLHFLGIGVGLIAIDPDDASSLRAVGIGTGVWTIIVPILALFVGGLVVGRVAPTVDNWNAAIHGIAVWALTTLLSMLMLSMMVGAVVRGATSAAGTAVKAGAVAGEQMTEIPSAIGLDTDDLVAGLNQQLAKRGMPPVREDELKAAMKESAQTAVRDGNLDREKAITIITKHTSLDRDQAEQVANDIDRQLQDVRNRAEEVGQKAGRVAMSAAETGGKVMLAMSVAMLLGLLAAVVGSLLSVRRERREVMPGSTPYGTTTAGTITPGTTPSGTIITTTPPVTTTGTLRDIE